MKLVFRGREAPRKFANLARRLPGVVDEALFKVAVDMRRDFYKTVETWTDKPTFSIEKRQRGYTVTTGSKVYLFVDVGTRAHMIRPKRAGGVLRFQAGYKAKTRPSFIGSRPGGPSGETLYRPEVHHPGTTGRRFTKVIHTKWQKRTGPEVQNLLRVGIGAVGL